MKAAFFRRLAAGALAVGMAVIFNVSSISCSPASAKVPAPPVSPQEDGYTYILAKGENGLYNKGGWNHYGPGYFDLDRDTGVLTGNGGMGLFWYSAKMYKDFVLEMDFLCDRQDVNSGVFFRVPYVPTSDEYIYDSFEIQIYDAAMTEKNPVMHEGAAAPKNDPMLHITGAVYDAKAPDKANSKPTGQWNHYKITAQGLNVTIELNGEEINHWQLQPAGKVATCWPEGYIGLQNHEPWAIHFANIRVKELKTEHAE